MRSGFERILWRRNINPERLIDLTTIKLHQKKTERNKGKGQATNWENIFTVHAT